MNQDQSSSALKLTGTTSSGEPQKIILNIAKYIFKDLPQTDAKGRANWVFDNFLAEFNTCPPLVRL